MPATFNALLDIIRAFTRTAVGFILLWLMAATFVGVNSPEHALTFGVLWFIAPIIVVGLIPVTSLTGAVASGWSRTAAFATVTANTLLAIWALGLGYTLLLFFVKWEGHTTALAVIVLCTAAALAIQTSRALGGWSGKASTLLVVLMAYTLFGVINAHDVVGKVSDRVGANVTGDPLYTDSKDGIADMREEAEAVEAAQRKADRILETEILKKDKAANDQWLIDATDDAAKGLPPCPRPTPYPRPGKPTASVGVLAKTGAPPEAVPTKFWDTDGDECELTVIVNKNGFISTSCTISRERTLALRWQREDGTPLRWKLEGRNEYFARFNWDEANYKWVGRGREGYTFHIEAESVSP